eukprot:758476-Hanusia_phi.AAC.3
MVQQLNEGMARESPGIYEGEGGPGALEHAGQRVFVELTGQEAVRGEAGSRKQEAGGRRQEAGYDNVSGHLLLDQRHAVSLPAELHGEVEAGADDVGDDLLEGNAVDVEGEDALTDGQPERVPSFSRRSLLPDRPRAVPCSLPIRSK